MASISSLSSSSTSSIYGNRNVLSGLASGLDTESMIENSVKGYKLKLSSLQQQRTKVEWKQSAYRSIISKMASFTQKYTSYTSGTNLLSANFFNSATKVSAMGKYADKVSATGKTNSDVKINSVKSLATAARYSVGAGNLSRNNVASTSFSLSEDNKPVLGDLDGSMTLNYGGNKISLRFREDDVFNTTTDANGKTIKGIDKMVNNINEQLENSNIYFDNGGGQVKASERIKAKAEGDGKIVFELVNKDDRNGVWISGTSGNIDNQLGLPEKIDSEDTSITSFNFNEGNVTKNDKSMRALIEERGFTITVDGKSHTIKGPTEGEIEQAGGDFIKALRTKINENSALKGKITVRDVDSGNDIKLRFDVLQEGTTFQVTSELDKHLGMEGGLTSYVNTSRTLNDVLGEKGEWDTWSLAAVAEDVTDKSGKIVVGEKGEKTYELKKGTDYYTDEEGNKFVLEGTKLYKANEDGERLYGFKINDETIEVSKEDTLEDLMIAVNSNKDAGVIMAYSKFTGKFTFTAKDTGAAGKIEFGEDGLAEKMFDVTGSAKAVDFLGKNVKDKKFSITVDGKEYGFTFDGNGATMNNIVAKLNGEGGLEAAGYKAFYDAKNGFVVKKGDKQQAVTYGEGLTKDLFAATGTHTKGTDAIFSATVNGEEIFERSSSSNTIDIDGMSVTLKNTFTAEKGDEITFSSEADADKIVEAVKSMVEDYNAMVTEIKKAYSTMPLTNSKGKNYEPLTDEDQADMSESAIKSYEEKAKTGLLFADRDLSNLYTGLTNALNMLGVSGNDAQKLGITTSYSDGTTTLALDESALRASLASDPDKVAEIFTRSTKNGASTDGLMQSLKTQLDKYAAVSGATKGILVNKAGSTLAPTSIYGNTLQRELDDFDKQITKWQDKLSDKIDYYNKKFTALEKLVAQMNNQSSMLMGLSGGY